jgi:molecular chaperone GrpE
MNVDDLPTVDGDMPARDGPSQPELLIQAPSERLAQEMADLDRRLVEAREDYDNLRRRTERERSDWIEQASAELVGQLLPVLDDLEYATRIECLDPQYARGIKIIYQRFADTLKGVGLEPIPAIGERFDPRLHEAVQRVEAGSPKEPLIVDEYQKGYTFNGRLLRASRVKVAVRL